MCMEAREHTLCVSMRLWVGQTAWDTADRPTNARARTQLSCHSHGYTCLTRLRARTRRDRRVQRSHAVGDVMLSNVAGQALHTCLPKAKRAPVVDCHNAVTSGSQQCKWHVKAHGRGGVRAAVRHDDGGGRARPRLGNLRRHGSVRSKATGSSTRSVQVHKRAAACPYSCRTRAGCRPAVVPHAL